VKAIYGSEYTLLFKDLKDERNPDGLHREHRIMVAAEKAWSQVTTEFVFHLEDDWTFLRSGFIEPALKILKSKTARHMSVHSVIVRRLV